MKVPVEILFVLLPAAVLLGMIGGMTMIRSDVVDGSKISVRGSVYTCKQVESGY